MRCMSSSNKHKSSGRSANLTWQLLTFARRSPSSPVALDPTGQVRELADLL